MLAFISRMEDYPKKWTVLQYQQTEQLEIKVLCKQKSPQLPQ